MCASWSCKADPLPAFSAERIKCFYDLPYPGIHPRHQHASVKITMNSQELCSKILKPSRVALLRHILEDYSRKVRLDGSAQALTSNPEIAETIAQWIQDERLDQPNSITAVGSPETGLQEIDPALVKAAAIKVEAKPKDDVFTHAFSHVSAYNRHDALWALKRCFYALIPKGVAIVTLTIRNPAERIVEEVMGVDEQKQDSEEVVGEEELMILAEEATFERGKVRLTRREVSIAGDELVALKNGLLERLEPQLNSNGGWRNAFEEAWMRETKKTGSLVIEAWLVVAMRWDLLCA
jgi:hypothetical protein